MSTRHELHIPPELDGERIDRALAQLNEAWTRSAARRLIEQRLVMLNDAWVKPAQRVSSGDVVVVEEPEPRPATTTAEAIPLDVLYEDESLLVVNKPANMVVHPAAGNPAGTLVNALLHHCDGLSHIGGVERPGIVHRLDKDTTGCLVVAKSDRTHRALSLAFSRRQVEKVYFGVCYGVPAQTDGVIDKPIGRHPSQRQLMAVISRGRPARTLYHLEETFIGTALLSFRLITGRTHQIRVHLAHAGHALVGDPQYAGRQWRNLPTPQLQALCRTFPRQALHAQHITFTHPVSNESLSISAPMPEDLRGLVEKLRQARGE